MSLVKGRHGNDQFINLLFESGYKFSVPLDANVSVEVVVTNKSDTTRNFWCTVLQSPVVLTTLNASLVSTTVSALSIDSAWMPLLGKSFQPAFSFSFFVFQQHLHVALRKDQFYSCSSVPLD